MLPKQALVIATLEELYQAVAAEVADTLDERQGKEEMTCDMRRAERGAPRPHHAESARARAARG